MLDGDGIGEWHQGKGGGELAVSNVLIGAVEVQIVTFHLIGKAAAADLVKFFTGMGHNAFPDCFKVHRTTHPFLLFLFMNISANS